MHQSLATFDAVPPQNSSPVRLHIRAIRKKLGEHRDLIETVRGVGYKFSDVAYRDAGD